MSLRCVTRYASRYIRMIPRSRARRIRRRRSARYACLLKDTIFLIRTTSWTYGSFFKPWRYFNAPRSRDTDVSPKLFGVYQSSRLAVFSQRSLRYRANDDTSIESCIPLSMISRSRYVYTRYDYGINAPSFAPIKMRR